ncbi:FAD-dependent oxidoreductase [Bradyrhizobium sp. U87765 SZCCT0131]|uniref:flavin monoamine oxidase family protein n=1 Tax=unclassified Bradyrhizobium TaxID=2631580 RepID=UPI001BAC23BB|nr:MULTISPECIES: FAD-dependent oxidoreductase [unclassified Bradyrhizobium]MBR1216757.1 FAD-dependent oxidoreductase [Bradyrhizobium sp. U87765 SZCCT0131]MBR1259487.1 FAD-dependent oxidoreductase [Bradyrhizobium sp. U87765 SZCCT0134]MBR1305628.1 FAD-dependent oxidoreductase [Bradyrhizobium sp. U87765 SZCCT0110]MBR1321995.1 FAD-dependent oxidoreductase [Bradyrhizobium sp. U87765 SZCCT0109]MBR1350727.1 FAD-dependent oxidoreductase [Bradyrhizobium sp. U87765 SZCCT0048]
MLLTRRNFVGLSLGLVVGGRSIASAAPLPRDADIVVIGAGAAGIAAARRIAAANRKVLVLEAGAAIGGRCQTDATTFDGPFDRGARWLYNPDLQPLAKLARSAGMELVAAPQGQKMRIGRRYARAGEAEDFLATLVRANRAIDDGARRADIACAAVLPKDLGDWSGATEFLLGPYATGKDLKDLSTVDQVRALRRDAAMSVRPGVGALMVKLAEGLPVALSTPATRIVWGNRDCTVETPAGNVSARVVIVTASTSVLTSGKIRFAPELPKRQLDAASKLTLGNSDHIALELPGNPLGLGRDDVLIEQSRDNRTASLVANVGGSSVCSVDVGGGFGRDLSAQGEAAMVAFAREWLGKLFGSDAVSGVRRTSVTRWDAAPYVLGAMSAAAPGAQGSRRVLGEPLGPLLLAGEATHETQWGTVGGAWESGERAADAALKRIGGAKEAAPAAVSRPARQSRPRHEAPRAPSSAMSWPRG